MLLYCLVLHLPQCGYALYSVMLLLFIRYGKRLGRDGGGGGGGGYSDQSYLALHAEDYDDAIDDTALLRPPQQPSEGDLMS